VNKKDGEIQFDPITRHMDADKLYESLDKASKRSRVVGTLKGIASFLQYTDGKLKKEMLPSLLKGSYEGTGDIMRKVLMIGEMWFMDVYNFDFQRVNKCSIHYVVPDERYGARVIPFCTMNNFHRSIVERKLAIPVAQYKNA
jgi:hypothetical protein